MRVVEVRPRCKPVVREIDRMEECWEEIHGNGWSACIHDGDDEFNFVATELAGYLGWYEDLNILGGTVVFTGEDGTDVPEFVVRAALRYQGVTG